MTASLHGLWRYLEGIGPYLMRIMSQRTWPQLESWTTTLAGFAKPMLKLVDKSDHDVNTANTASPLLNLPPELRNRIYEFVLVEPQEIQVHQQNIVKPPALLASCKQIRSEARRIFFNDNTFRIWSQDFSGRLVLNWRRHFEDSRRDTQGNKLKVGIALLGQPNWSNLVQWLKAQFDEGMLMNFDSESFEQRHHMYVVYHSTNLIVGRAQSAGRSWNEVEQDLEDLHSAIAACEPTWN